MMEFVDYYDLIGLPLNASKHEIKERINTLTGKWNPSQSDLPNAYDLFFKVQYARDTLLDDSKRTEYDRTWRIKKTSASVEIEPSQGQTVQTKEYREEIKQNIDKLFQARSEPETLTTSKEFQDVKQWWGKGSEARTQSKHDPKDRERISEEAELSTVVHGAWAVVSRGFVGWFFVASLFLPIVHIATIYLFFRWAWIEGGGTFGGMGTVLGSVLLGMVLDAAGLYGVFCLIKSH